MKKAFLPIILFSAALSMMSGCYCIRGLGSNASDTSMYDSVILHHWDSTFAAIIKNPVKGRIFKLNPMEKPGNSNDNIAGYPIESTSQQMNAEQLAILKFILSNEKCYSNDSNLIKTYFAPYLAVEFYNKKKKMYLLIGYNTPEWAVATQDTLIKRGRYSRKDLLLQFATGVYPDDEYLKSIQNINK